MKKGLTHKKINTAPALLRNMTLALGLRCVALHVGHARDCGRVLKRPNLGHIITSDGHSKKAIRATKKKITPVDSTLGEQTNYKISKA